MAASRAAPDDHAIRSLIGSARVGVLLALLLAASLAGCKHAPPLSPEVADRMTTCDDMANVFKSSKKFGINVDAGVAGGAVGLEIIHAQLPSSQVLAMRAMVAECRLWARGEAGHDANHLSEAMLRYAGVYVAAPDDAQIQARLKVVEDAIGKVHNSDGSPTVALNASYTGAIAAQGQVIYADPHLATTIINDEVINSLQDEVNRSNQSFRDDEIQIAALQDRIDRLERAQAPKPDGSAAGGKVPADLGSRGQGPGELGSEELGSGGQGQGPGGPIPGDAKLGSNPRPSYVEEGVVYFGSNTDRLSPQSTAYLDAYAEQLVRLGIKTIDILGFADERGTDDYNNTLSRRRADTVSDYLKNKKIKTNHLFGQGKTLAFGEALALNRRVRITPLPAAGRGNSN